MAVRKTKKAATAKPQRAEEVESEGASDKITERVGSALRALRHARGYSLEEMAALSGVSRATLSQIETNKTNPTIGVLWKISTGLGVPFSALLGQSEPDRVLVVRRAMQGQLTSDDGRFQSRSLGPSRLLGNVELYELTLAPRTLHRSPPHPPGTQESLHVVAGVIRVGVGEIVRDAGAGDTVFFGADQEHFYENPGKTPARLINAIVYARSG
jgi:transcriptional regulator with XRE-family HTH domain